MGGGLHAGPGKPARGGAAVLLDFGDWRMTVREAVFSVFIVGVLAAAGFFASNAIERWVHARQLVYRQAAQVDNNPDEFRLALDTDVGHLFAEGDLEAADPVKHESLDGEWFSVDAAYQKYTKHTRTRTRTVGDGKGRTRTQTRVETYWSWDTYDYKRSSAGAARFLGVEFPSNRFDLRLCGERKVVSTGFNRRIEFEVVPKKMHGTLFAAAKRGAFEGTAVFWNGVELQDAYSRSVSSRAKELFWIAWSAVIAFALYAFFYAENRWLEDAK